MSLKADVERVLRNLLDNAIRHAPNGSTTDIEVDTDQGTEHLVIRGASATKARASPKKNASKSSSRFTAPQRTAPKAAAPA